MAHSKPENLFVEAHDTASRLCGQAQAALETVNRTDLDFDQIIEEPPIKSQSSHNAHFFQTNLALRIWPCRPLGCCRATDANEQNRQTHGRAESCWFLHNIITVEILLNLLSSIYSFPED